MDELQNAQALGKHEIVPSFDREFMRVHSRSRSIIERVPAELLYAGGEKASSQRQSVSVGESVLRAAAAIEQTFGGITANLWDDPFEWTLPEYLTTQGKVLDHLEDVESTRRRAFSSFTEDSCLLKRVATPSNESQPLIELLLETLVRATFYQSQAAVVLKNLSGISTAGFII